MVNQFVNLSQVASTLDAVGHNTVNQMALSMNFVEGLMQLHTVS